ncbi:MAG TPA: enoyl-CoA hydratase [Xanthobacteraceae bacterium]|jgi:enoyl-CoA hydratase|nr:enoyl-CoA hydratase [Xanthobacteraceae bacterium]
MAYENIRVETKGRVGLITLDRPKALNALNGPLIDELNKALDTFENNSDIGCVVLTGSEKAFAAGADIKQMQSMGYPQNYLDDFVAAWERIGRARKPIVAAVAGYALGGGCELLMMCDIVIAADNAQFGQPEIKLGVMPGIGGTQRLTRFIGKAKAMDLCLTGRMMGAEEAERAGLVSRIVPAASLLDEAMKTAEVVAGMSLPIAMMTKESVNQAYETTLSAGIRFERRVFHAMFATADQKEGMAAFVDKRAPSFKHR